MVKNNSEIKGIFPGRFQPPTNAHIMRIETIREKYPYIKLYIVIGDTGVLNKENFLTPEDRLEMFNSVLKRFDWKNTEVVVVKGAPGKQWVENLSQVIPDFKYVFSDNPFVLEPLRTAGFKTIEFKREGYNSGDIRSLPFQLWGKQVPPEIFNYIKKNKLQLRLEELSPGGKYPFLKNENTCSE